MLLSLELTLGARTLIGVVQRKQEAVAAYETAIEDGDTAILFEKASDGLFTVSLGNLLPGEQAVIRYRYAQVLAFEQGQLRMALPMTIAPRYGNAHAALTLPHMLLLDVASRRRPGLKNFGLQVLLSPDPYAGLGPS